MATVEPESKEAQLALEILRLYDDFTEFNDRCAFLCDAFVGIVSDPESLEESTINGLSYYSHWLKHQVGDFKETLCEIQRQSRSIYR